MLCAAHCGVVCVCVMLACMYVYVLCVLIKTCLCDPSPVFHRIYRYILLVKLYTNVVLLSQISVSSDVSYYSCEYKVGGGVSVCLRGSQPNCRTLRLF